MYTSRIEQLPDDRGIKIAIDRDSSRISYTEVVRAWRSDADFRSFFNNLLASAPFTAFRWETPPVTVETAGRSFEFVVLDRPSLAYCDPDANPFSEHFRNADRDGAIAFPNLGGDALLIVPRPSEPLSAYAHLAAFVRYADKPQQHSFWQLVGEEMQSRLGSQPVWLNTAGGGVSWLHVRLDDRPKYYGYTPYKLLDSMNNEQ